MTITKKFVASAYVGDPYGCAKFGANPSTGASGQMGEIQRNFYLGYFYFFNELTGQTRRRIFTLDGSNDADGGLAQGCAFWGFR